MREKNLFYFKRRDILPAAHYDVLLAIDDEEVAVFVPGSHVAGMKPSTAQSLGRGFRLLPVAFQDTIRASDNFPHRLSIARHVLVVCVDDAKLDAGNGITGHRLPDEPLLSLPGKPRFHRRDC